MKAQLREAVAQAIGQMINEDLLPAGSETAIPIERTRDRSHGDFACNSAMALARAARRPPRELAEQLVARLPETGLWSEVGIAGPGFINFTLAPSAYHRVVREALEQGARFGTSELGANRPVQVEFVSANPTGPLHVGHGRGAAYGDTLANLLQAVGFDVQREYYVNDAGRQMDILATSVWLRYLELCGESLPFPSNGYRGDYVGEFAQTLKKENGNDYLVAAADVFRGIPADEPQGGDKETHIDALVHRCRTLLGEAPYQRVFQLALQSIVADIREDLHEFGVDFDRWYSEGSLSQNALIDKAIDRLKDNGHVYERDGALWFRATDFGDEKDRVVRRENGQTTYFASDIAYHMDKLDRGFERVIDVWGADHHGYIARVKAALAALGRDPGRLDVLLVQFANLYRGGQKVQMSTRSGSFVTLRELREEVGVDSARFFYVMRKCEQHLDFDLDLAKSRSNDNPVFYIQYAHARICSVMSQLEHKGWQHEPTLGTASLARLEEQHEQDLLVGLSRFPETVEAAALNSDPHLLTQYLRDLAHGFHTYYNAHQFLVEDAPLRAARLNLILATRQAIANGLTLLGVSAPESM